MALRAFAAVLLLAVVADTASAQRPFRRGYYGNRGRTNNIGTMPYYPPYQFTFGGPWAPIQYFTPPIILHNGRAYQTYSLTPYGYVYGPVDFYGPGLVPVPGYQPYRVGPSYGATGLSVQTGVTQATAKPTLKPVPQNGSSLPTPDEIEPDPVVIQQAGAGDVASAIRFQKQADLLFRSGNYNRAFTAYKSSQKADQTRAEPYFRIATVFMALGRYEPAIRYLKQGLDFKPDYAKTPELLRDIYGPGGEELKASHVGTLRRWADELPASADRQLLTGAMLHFDNRKAESIPYLERAVQTSRRPGRAAAILSAQSDAFTPPTENGSLILDPDPGDPQPKANAPGLVIPPPPAPDK